MEDTRDDSLARALRGIAESGAAEHWNRLVDLAGPELFALCRQVLADSSLAEDAVQESLLRVGAASREFSGSEAEARNWVRRISCRVALNLLRQRSRARQRDMAYSDAAAQRMDVEMSPGEAALNSEQLSRVREAIEDLPEQLRFPLICRFYGGLEYDQIAAELGCPVGTARVNVHRGLERLRERLTGFGIVVSGEVLALQRLPFSHAPGQLARWKALHRALPGAQRGLSVMAKSMIVFTAVALVAAGVLCLPRVWTAEGQLQAGDLRAAPPQPGNPVLGDAVEITAHVTKLADSLAFFAKLGFKQLSIKAEAPASALLTDGMVLLSLDEQAELPLALTYFVADVPAKTTELEKAGFKFESKTASTAVLRDASGLPLRLVRSGADALPKVEGKPVCKCGMFGEFALKIKDLKASTAEWEKLGFKSSGGGADPHPWLIMLDGRMVMGLHQSNDPTVAPFALTYFADEMDRRIKDFKADGIKPVQEFKDSKGRDANAVLKSPDGLVIYLFGNDM